MRPIQEIAAPFAPEARTLRPRRQPGPLGPPFVEGSLAGTGRGWQIDIIADLPCIAETRQIARKHTKRPRWRQSFATSVPF